MRAAAIVGKDESRQATHAYPHEAQNKGDCSPLSFSNLWGGGAGIELATPLASKGEFSFPCGRLTLPQSVGRLQGFIVSRERGRSGKTRHT
jgi:hypothetical protein